MVVLRYLFWLTVLVLSCGTSLAQERGTEFLGMFVQGQRVGYVSSTSIDLPEGRKTVSGTYLNAKILGFDTKLIITSEAISSKSGRLMAQKFLVESGGRTQTVSAKFGEKEIEVVREADGKTENRTLKIPDGALIVDDSLLTDYSKGAPEVGSKMVYYVLDPMALVLVRNEVEFKGKQTFVIDNEIREGYLVFIKEPRGSTSLYVNSSGKLLYGETLLGISFKPISREDALGSSSYAPSIDLATATRNVPEGDVDAPRDVSRLEISLTGKELERLKSDPQQTVKRVSENEIHLTVHPFQADPSKAHLIESVRREVPGYVKPSLYIPSDQDEFVELAKKIVGSEKNSYQAAAKICDFVHRTMRPNAGIGMLRDASEILRTKEGVCRDYSILAATLARAAGLPTKVVTGAVFFEGAFYYHAWIEVWTGIGWQPFDPTLGGSYFDATHIKFVEGNPDQAFLSFTFDGVKIRILNKSYRQGTNKS